MNTETRGQETKKKKKLELLVLSVSMSYIDIIDVVVRASMQTVH